MITSRRGFLAALFAAPVLARVAPAPAAIAAPANDVIPLRALGYEFFIDLNHVRYVTTLDDVVRTADAGLLGDRSLKRAARDGRRGRRAHWPS